MCISKYQTQMFLFIQISLSCAVLHFLLAVLYVPSLASIQIWQDKSDVAESFPFQCSALHVGACMPPGRRQTSVSVSQKWHASQSSRSAICLCFSSTNRTAPRVCQGLVNEPPLLSWGASNCCQPPDTTTCRGWKLFNNNNKKDWIASAVPICNGWQPNLPQAWHAGPLSLMQIVSDMPDSTRLIYRNQLQGKSPAFLLQITESWIPVINFFSSLYAKEVPYMSQQGRFHSLAYPAAAAQTVSDDTTNICKIGPLICQLKGKNWVLLGLTVKRQMERKCPKFHNLWRGRKLHKKFGQHCSTMTGYLGPSFVSRITWEFISSVSK